MRLRNIPRAKGTIQMHLAVVKRPEAQKGCWKQVFGNNNPIYIEIGMGKGQFILNMAAKFPQINFIGIERYSSVLLRALEKFDTESYRTLTNVRFICMDAAELTEVFAPGEIDRVYLNFSDPWPKSRHARRRLTSQEYLSRYEQFLKPQGVLEFKTDNTELFKFSLEQIDDAGWTLHNFTFDLHHNEKMNQDNVMTEYEEKFSAKGHLINKLVASQKPDV